MTDAGPGKADAHGLIFAYLLDGKGGGERIGWEKAKELLPNDELVWLHMVRTNQATQHWLRHEAGVDEIVVDSLLAEQTRPRVTPINDGLLVNLRGINFNPDADPEDMLALRLWMKSNGVISLRKDFIKAAREVADRLDAGTGPTSSGELLIELAESIAENMAPVIDQAMTKIDALEDAILENEHTVSRAELSDIRRRAITIRRYLTPQRDAIAHLHGLPTTWLTSVHRNRLYELSNLLSRYIEDLESIRERAMVSHEELAARLSERNNRTLYVLSLVAAIFLPLGFITGLLGINVAGMPGAHDSHAFWIVCGLLVMITSVQLVVFKWLHWL